MIEALESATGAESLSNEPPRQPLWRFLLVAIPTAFVLAMMVSGLLGRFQLALDVQERLCLPGHRFFLVDQARHDVKRGDVLAFLSDAQTPLEPPGVWIAKMVIGLPGDHVRVTPDIVEVNGKTVGVGLLLAPKAGVPLPDLVRELVVPPGHVWAMGATVDSYDSRYYGPVPLWKMRGTVTGLF
jgi:conjugal transfer pilin signal peptidase TrbI